MKFVILVQVIFFVLFNCKPKVSSIDNYPKVEGVISTKNNNIFISQLNQVPNITLPFSSKKIEDYIIFYYDRNNSTIKSDIFLKHDLLKKIKIPISNSERLFFDHKKKEKGKDLFYPIGKFRDSLNLHILFIYEDYEDIMPCVTTQLNKYNFKGEIIDTLVLDKKFHFEIIYTNDFEINDVELFIEKKEINYYNEYDDLLPEGSAPNIKKTKKFYTLNKKKFNQK